MLRKLLQTIALLLVLVLMFFAAFYAWGGSGSLSSDELTTITTYDEVRPVQAVPGDTFTVMTYNIGYLSGMTNNAAVERTARLYSDNLKAATRLLQRVDPDIAAFQEIDFGARRSYFVDQADTLARLLGYPAAAVAVNWDDQYVPFPGGLDPSHHFGRVLSGQAVLSRYPILKQERIVLQQPARVPTGGLPAPFDQLGRRFYIDRLAQVVQLDVGQPLTLINVHLEAFDQATREEQARHILELYRYHASRRPVVLLGDFNAVLPHTRNHTPAVDSTRGHMAQDTTMATILQGEGLQEAFPPEAFDRPEATFTFSSAEPYQKIDHVLYDSRRIEAVDAWVVDGPDQPSDHRAVVMRFVLKPDTTLAQNR